MNTEQTFLLSKRNRSWLATKAPVYAVDRIEALKKAGFELSDQCLKGSYGGRVYDGYWVIRENTL